MAHRWHVSQRKTERRAQQIYASLNGEKSRHKKSKNIFRAADAEPKRKIFDWVKKQGINLSRHNESLDAVEPAMD